MISAGARAESNDSFGTRVVPRAGLAYTMRLGRDFWGATRLRFSYGEGIKEPRFDQSFSTNPCIPGNPNLRPERSRTFHVGLDQRLAADRLRLSADFFHNRFRDIVSFASGQFLGTPPSFCGFFFGTFFNTDLARARGLDLVAEVRPAPWLTVSGNYTYDGSRVLEAPNAFDPASMPGNRLLRRPVHSGNLAANAAFRRMNWNVYAYFTGRRADSTFLNPTVTSTPGYARFDLTGSYRLGRNVSVFGRIENLFDKRYQEALGFPALGRDYRLGMKYTIGGE
jgi:vitamin B12 transporter